VKDLDMKNLVLLAMLPLLAARASTQTLNEGSSRFDDVDLALRVSAGSTGWTHKAHRLKGTAYLGSEVSQKLQFGAVPALMVGVALRIKPVEVSANLASNLQSGAKDKLVNSTGDKLATKSDLISLNIRAQYFLRRDIGIGLEYGNWINTLSHITSGNKLLEANLKLETFSLFIPMKHALGKVTLVGSIGGSIIGSSKDSYYNAVFIRHQSDPLNPDNNSETELAVNGTARTLFAETGVQFHIGQIPLTAMFTFRRNQVKKGYTDTLAGGVLTLGIPF
jgi:hypothetical protein